MEVTAWALGPVGESAIMRKVRLDSFLTFYGPGGFATPDDVEALEQVQAGLTSTVKEVPWSVMTRGIAKEGEQLNSDELHLRTFWRRWNEMMTGEPAAVGGRPGSRVGNTVTVSREAVEDFLYHEAALLDAWELDAWDGTAVRRCTLPHSAE